jgi:hypothetical protein
LYKVGREINKLKNKTEEERGKERGRDRKQGLQRLLITIDKLMVEAETKEHFRCCLVDFKYSLIANVTLMRFQYQFLSWFVYDNKKTTHVDFDCFISFTLKFCDTTSEAFSLIVLFTVLLMSQKTEQG